MHKTDLRLLTTIYTDLPQQFPIDEDSPYALKDKEFAGLTFWCMDKSRGSVAIDAHDASFAEQIPPPARQARAQYERLRMHPFFERFVLFLRTEERDGAIVAVGRDEFYYVLAAWNATSERVWVPEFFVNDMGHHKLTSACLGHDAQARQACGPSGCTV